MNNIRHVTPLRDSILKQPVVLVVNILLPRYLSYSWKQYFWLVEAIKPLPKLSQFYVLPNVVSYNMGVEDRAKTMLEQVKKIAHKKVTSSDKAEKILDNGQFPEF